MSACIYRTHTGPFLFSNLPQRWLFDTSLSCCICNTVLDHSLKSGLIKHTDNKVTNSAVTHTTEKEVPRQLKPCAGNTKPYCLCKSGLVRQLLRKSWTQWNFLFHWCVGMGNDKILLSKNRIFSFVCVYIFLLSFNHTSNFQLHRRVTKTVQSQGGDIVRRFLEQQWEWAEYELTYPSQTTLLKRIIHNSFIKQM